MASETNKNKRVGIVAIILLAIALLITGVFAFKTKSNLSDLQVAHKELQTEFDQQVAELQKVQAENQGLQTKLSDQNGEIEKMKKEIADLIAKDQKSVGTIVALTRKIANFKSEVENYKKRITELEAQVAQLTGEKQVLTEEKQVLTTENTDLKSKVEKASEIKAVNFDVKVVKRPRLFGSKNRVTENSNKVKKIDISFFLQSNFLAKDGDKEVYISILNPDKSLFVDKTFASGEKTFENGTSIKYTQVVKLAYTNTGANKISSTYYSDKKMAPGRYHITVYDDQGMVISDDNSFYFDLLGKGY